MPIVGYKFYGRNIRPYLYAPEKKSYTILAMTLFSLVVFGAFAIRPSLFTISRLNREVKKAREAKTFLDQKISNLSQAQVNYQLASEDLELVDQALPRETAVPAILETLASIAGGNNVTLSETKFKDVEGEDLPAGRQGSLKTLPFMIAVTGDFADVEKFIAELENGVRQMDVKQVKMGRGEEEPEQMIAEIGLVTYFYED